MRILFSFVGGNGHFEPLVPIARAAQAAGHTVAFTGRPGMIPLVQKRGFNGFPSGLDYGDSTEKFPLLRVDMDRENAALRKSFAGKIAQTRAADIITLCAEWQPDVLVCDEIDFGAMIAAESLGLPYASVIVIAAGSFVRQEIVGEPLNELRAQYGLAPDPDLTMLSRYLVLSPVPNRFRDPAYSLPDTAHSVRLLASDTQKDYAVPEWLNTLLDVPTVYFTLGTVFNREAGDLFSRVIDGLSSLAINLIVTVGYHLDPAELGEQPAHVHIEQYIPQSLILPRCAAVVSHGGSGSVIGSLAHGLPSVLIPMGADQPLNAARCEALGASIVLDAVDATPESIRQALSTILEDSRYRTAAESLREEIIAMPEPAHAVTLLEKLAQHKQRITAV